MRKHGDNETAGWHSWQGGDDGVDDAFRTIRRVRLQRDMRHLPVLQRVFLNGGVEWGGGCRRRHEEKT